MHKVFVYGSLKQGFHNFRLLHDAPFIGVDKTKGTLLDLGSFPGLLAEGQTTIHGEVYEVDGRSLARLDRLEGHPDFYKREFHTLESGQQAWVYFINEGYADKRRRISSGIWEKK